MKFLVQIHRGYSVRTVEVEAPHGAAARAIGGRMCEEGEIVPSAETAVILYARRTVEPNAKMPPGHARAVAEGGRRAA